MKRIISFVIVLIMILSCWGCKETEEPVSTSSGSGSSAKKPSVKLAYCDNDYMNPYTCVTKVNRRLSVLIYESLVGVDENFNSVNILASDINHDGKKITVKLKSGVLFSDGSNFSSGDVKYSFDLAKKAEYIRSAELATVTSCKVIDELTVEFAVSNNDNFAVNLLTFPIIKSGSDKLESSDNVLYDPIGTGRYVRTDHTLNVNANYRTDDTKLKTISLVNTPNQEALEHGIFSGRISVYYSDMTDGEIPQMLGKSVDTTLANLVYIGVNNNEDSPLDSDMRQVISSALNRNAICEQAFMGFAEPAAGLFPASWSQVAGLQTILPESDNDNVLAKLDEIGYNTMDTEGYRRNGNNKTLSVNILVNKDSKVKSVAAETVAAQLKTFGIKANITYKGYEDYLTALTDGNFELYLGEIQFKNNLDPSQLLTYGGSAAWGAAAPIETKQDTMAEGEQTQDTTQETDMYSGSTQEKIVGYYYGDTLFSEILITFMSELPVIPICYRNGWLGYTSDIPDGVLQPWVSNAYNGIWNIE